MQITINFIHAIGTDSISKNLTNFHLAINRTRSDVNARIVDTKKNPKWIDELRLNYKTSEDTINVFSLRQYHPYIQQIPGKNVLWFWFEITNISKVWIDQIDQFDLIWVSSRWAKGILIKHGIPEGKIHIVHVGIDPNVYRATQKHVKKSREFRFLFIGKHEPRKGLDVAIFAFQCAFPLAEYPDITFYIKSNYFNERNEELKSQIQHDNRITLDTTIVSEIDLARMIQGADCVLMPSRAEGFGMSGIESLACGTPLIATYCSGQTEYLDFVSGAFISVPFEEVKAVDPDFTAIYGAEFGSEDIGTWSEPSLAGLAESMMNVFHSKETIQKQVDLASQVITEKFSWDVIATSLICDLRKKDTIFKPVIIRTEKDRLVAIIVDTYDLSFFPKLAIEQVIRTNLAFEVIHFGAKEIHPGAKFVRIASIKRTQDYTDFILKALPFFVPEGHVMIFQWDGFPIQPQYWNSRFLDYDYIGAPWVAPPRNGVVGNGGFSIRSSRLLKRAAQCWDELEWLKRASLAEDLFVCEEARVDLTNSGLRFAPLKLAENFSFENRFNNRSFGFHGQFNFPLFMDEHLLLENLAELKLRCQSLIDREKFIAISRAMKMERLWREILAA